MKIGDTARGRVSPVSPLSLIRCSSSTCLSIASAMALSAPRALVLVDHRGPLAVVAHARHEIAQPGPAVGRELVAAVA
jgi:hypothetical protein